MKAEGSLLTAAMVIAAIRIWTQMRGKAKTPFVEWAIGWGALFFILALLASVSPLAAAMLAWLVAIADFLTNGVSLTQDISTSITQAEKGQTIFQHS